MLAQRLSGALGKVSQVDQTARGLVVSLAGGILFDTGKSELKSDAKVTLAKLAGILMMVGDIKIQVEGHTDSTGSVETNDKLSNARAKSVMDFLAEQGVESPRMTSAGFGSTKGSQKELVGDPLLRSITSRMSNSVSQVIGSGTYSTLGSLGVQLGRDGKLTLDGLRNLTDADVSVVSAATSRM